MSQTSRNSHMVILYLDVYGEILRLTAGGTNAARTERRHFRHPKGTAEQDYPRSRQLSQVKVDKARLSLLSKRIDSLLPAFLKNGLSVLDCN